MRIGLMIYGSLETVTGGFLYDRMLVEHLRRKGDEVKVISIPWHSYTRSLFQNFSRPLFRRLHDDPFDLLLQDELTHPSLFWLNQRLRRAVSHPIATIVHLLRSSEPRPAWQGRIYRLVERRYLRTVDGLICNSEATRSATAALAGPERPSVVAYPGGDHLSPTITEQQIEQRAHESGPLRVLFLGNVSIVKGLHTLVEALGRLPRASWRLTVLGSLTAAPAYVRAIHGQIVDSGLASRMELLGALPHSEVASYLERAQVLAVPSLHEAFGIAYLEALGFGLPVIASAQGAASEFVGHGKEGFLVAPGDSGVIAQHLALLHSDRALLARMGLNASARYAAHPTWAESAESVRAFLQNLVRRTSTAM